MALVTGAAGGIGRAVLGTLGEAGACIVGFDLDAEGAQDAVAPLADRGLVVGGDATSDEAVVAREAFRVMRQQAGDAAIVFVASKNAVVAGKNAAAYSSAKAGELHLARCLAEEGGAAGIRVNTVNPDAVLEGSRIWGSSWRRSGPRRTDCAPGAGGALPRPHHPRRQHPPRRHRPGRAPLCLPEAFRQEHGEHAER